MSDKWIDVKDRLPEYEIPVLVCAKGKEDSVYICRLASRLESKLNVSLS